MSVTLAPHCSNVPSDGGTFRLLHPSLRLLEYLAHERRAYPKFLGDGAERFATCTEVSQFANVHLGSGTAKARALGAHASQTGLRAVRHSSPFLSGNGSEHADDGIAEST